MSLQSGIQEWDCPIEGCSKIIKSIYPSQLENNVRLHANWHCQKYANVHAKAKVKLKSDDFVRIWKELQKTPSKP